MAPRKRSRKVAVKKVEQGGDGMSDNPEDCPVCLTAFDDAEQRSRTLPCGHTFCTRCLNEVQEQNQVTCPTCRSTHPVPEAGNFPINYAFEAMIKRLRATSVGSISPPPCTEKGTGGQKGIAGLSKSMRSLIEEQEAKVLVAIIACQEMQSQLDEYQATLTDWHDQQQQLEDKLQALIDESKSSRVLVQQERSHVAEKKKQMQQGEQQLQAALETLQRVDTDQEAGGAVVDVFRFTDDADQWVEDCRELFPNVDTVTTARRVIEVSSASLEGFKSALATMETSLVSGGAAGNKCNLEAAPASTIMDRLQALQTPTLWAEDLYTLTQPARSLLKAGLVFATHKVEGQCRHGRISFEGDRLYLHCLQDQTVPRGAAILQVDKVVPATPPCLVFLDLACPGRAPRRVLIRLNLDTSLGRHFELLCTGRRGPSYINTRLLWVENKGQPGERVYGGDYDKNDGTGGAAILPHLDVGDYRKSGRAGAVCRVWRDEDMSDWNSLFAIRTKDGQEGTVGMGVFGEVVEGLEGVMVAAKHNPIAEVSVVDCGVVLWDQSTTTTEACCHNELCT